MIFLGLLTSAFLAIGGAFMYYYAHEHATHTGRKWVLGCLISAPMCGVVGVLQYPLLTINFSQSMGNFGLNTSSMYGPGFALCCMLSLASCMPIYIQSTFSKRDPHEKTETAYDE